MSTFRTGQLPAPIGDRLIGRDDDLRQVEQALSRSSCVTLLGPGGVGKTRLATEAARRLGATWGASTAFIDLLDVDNNDPIGELLTAALQDAGGTGDSLTSVIESLKPLILVLDGASPTSIPPSLATTRDVRLICAARQPTGLPGEVIVQVEPLNEDAALELLKQKSFEAGGPADGLDVLLRHVAGLPLAIELVAARLRMFSPGDLVALFDEPGFFDQSFGWAWETLPEAARHDLGLLAPNAGPFSLPDAARSFGASLHDAADRLQSLVELSVLQVRRVGGSSQYVILAPIREVVVHKLRDEHPTLYSTAVRRHAESWLEDLPRNASLTGVARVVRDCQAVAPTLAVRVAIQSLDPLYVRHNAAAAGNVVRRALAACTAEMTEERIDLLCVAAEVWARHFRDLRRASELVDEAFELGVDHETRRVSVRNAQGLVALAEDDFDTADRFLTEAVGLVESTPEDPSGASAYANLGLCRLATGQFAKAAEWLQRALDAELPVAEHHAVQGRLAMALFHSGEVQRATELLERGRTRARRDELDAIALSYSIHLGRLRIDPQPREAVDAALRSEDPSVWLDGALLAWTLGDNTALQRLGRIDPARVAPLTLGIAMTAAALAVIGDRPLEAMELARRAMAAVPMGEVGTRAIVSLVAFDACRRADRDREAASWREAAEREAARCAVPSVEQLIDGADIAPMFDVLVAERARLEGRYTRWSWVDLALALQPVSLPKAAESGAGSKWQFANEARMVQCPDGKTLNLSRRGPMRKILWHLVQMHAESPGEGVSVDDVFEIGWPGEIVDYELALARVYNTIRAARGLGFEELIITQDDGYLLDPAARVDVL